MSKEKIFLISLLFFSLVIRLWQLETNPSGFFADEASIGYNAYTILTKGTDEYGTRYPLFFQAFGEYKNPIQVYSTVPFVALFGLNEFSVRLTSVFYGVLSILAIYLLTKELFKDNKYTNTAAFFASLLLAISPWHLHFSRIAFEMMPYVFFTTSGAYLLLKYKNSFDTKYLILSFSSFCLSLYSYSTARLFIPFFLLFLVFIYFPEIFRSKKTFLIALIISTALLIPFVSSMLSSSGWNRFQQVSIFARPPRDQSITQHIYNNYISHFSFEFLFQKGDAGLNSITRHSLRNLGELYLFQLPLILSGMFFLLLKKQWRGLLLITFWLLLFPTGSMFTEDKFAQATRSIIGVVPFQILSAYGLIAIISLFKNKILKRIVISAMLVITIYSTNNYLQLYFRDYPLYSSDFWGWQYGPRDIMKYFLTAKDQYDDLYMSGEFNGADIFPKFYDPENKCQNKCKIGDFLREPTIYDSTRRQLFSLSPEYLKNSQFKDNFKTQKTLYYPNGQIAFLIGEVKPPD